MNNFPRKLYHRIVFSKNNPSGLVLIMSIRVTTFSTNTTWIKILTVLAPATTQPLGAGAAAAALPRWPEQCRAPHHTTPLTDTSTRGPREADERQPITLYHLTTPLPGLLLLVFSLIPH